jgi:putative phosphoesterase
MRILILSDIHANWVALRTIQEPFDVCLFLGDLVDYGVEPIPCIEWVRKNATYWIRGNHDHGAAQDVLVQGFAGFRYLTAATRPLTRQHLSEADRRFLAAMPTTQAATIHGKRYFLVHGTPRDPLDEFAPPESDFWMRRLDGIDADFVCVGHTHQPYILQVGKTTVINPGSVGLPRDGDPRIGYAVITDQVIELRRVEYPIEEAIAAVQKAALPDHAKTMLADVYRHGRMMLRNGNGNGHARNGNGNGTVRKMEGKT